MKIGVVTTSFPRTPGDFRGGFVGEQVQFLKEQGHQVEVVAAAPAGTCPVGPGADLFRQSGAPEALQRLSAWPDAARFQTAQLLEVARCARHWDFAFAHWLVPSGLSVLLASRVPSTVVCHSGDLYLLRRLGLLSAFAALARSRRARLPCLPQDDLVPTRHSRHQSAVHQDSERPDSVPRVVRCPCRDPTRSFPFVG